MPYARASRADVTAMSEDVIIIASARRRVASSVDAEASGARRHAFARVTVRARVVIVVVVVVVIVLVLVVILRASPRTGDESIVICVI